MSRPRILIPVPTSFDEAYNTKCWPEYAAAIQAAGGEPVQVALSHPHAELEALVRGADGVLLPGSGADVDPALYGAERHPATADADTPRQRTDRALLEAAEHTCTSLLGICLGLQTLNVFHGGTLRQDLDPFPVNHVASRAVYTAHTITLERGSRLASLEAVADGTFRLGVNSSHHQAVHIPGERLRVIARCPQDETIEAVESTDTRHWLVGVQWHPERTYTTSEASALLFRTFVAAASH